MACDNSATALATPRYAYISIGKNATNRASHAPHVAFSSGSYRNIDHNRIK
jgi:hypothetical protein